MDAMKYLEKEDIYIQPYPCRLIVDEEVIRVAALFAILDFKLGYNRARKISVQFLLRLSGISQIHRAIEKIFDKKIDNYYIVVFSKGQKTNLKSVKGFLEDVCGQVDGCMRDMNKIITFYDINNSLLKAAKRPRENDFEAVKKIIIEKLATQLFW